MVFHLLVDVTPNGGYYGVRNTQTLACKWCNRRTGWL